GEELLFRVAAEKGHVAGIFIVLVIVEATLHRRNTANFLEWRKCANNRNSAAVEVATHLRIVAELRHHVFARGRFFRDLNVIVFGPTVHAAGRPAARLHAGATAEHDHDVLAERFLIFLDAITEALACGDHNRDRDDSPSDAEHGEKRAALLRPERDE